MFRSLATLSLAAALVAGCAAIDPKAAPDDIEIVDGDEAADGYTSRLSLQGTIAFGESIDATYASRGYAGWIFTGTAGARALIEATPTDGSDTVLSLYGPMTGRSWSRARAIAVNDDYRGSLGSHLEVRLPSDGTYLVVVREYWRDSGRFTLSLGCGSDECRALCGADGRCPTGSACERIVCVRAPCNSYCAPIDPTVACAADADCTAIPTGCCSCSMGGDQRAVSAAYADELRPSCDARDPVICPAVYLCGAEQAACVAGRCEMVPAIPEGECAESECGVAPRIVTLMCEDGSVGGFTGRCLRHDDGSCGWEIRACPTPGTTCGGFAGVPCAEGQYCDYAPEAICGWADATGTCRETPSACTREYVPVCGCDGRTYSNRCTANAAGVSVRAEGACAG